jgi:hypothetical protein
MVWRHSNQHSRPWGRVGLNGVVDDFGGVCVYVLTGRVGRAARERP